MTEVTKQELIEAINGLEVNEANFTTSGKPDAKVLTDILNKKVSASLRDEVWAEMAPAPVDPEPPVADTPPEPVAPDAVAVGGDDSDEDCYTNMTDQNIFTTKGRCGGGFSVMLSADEAAGFGDKIMLSADVPVESDDE